MKSATYVNKTHNTNYSKWGENRVFQVFFLISGTNPCFWVNIGGWYVNMQSMGKKGKKNASKNECKLMRIGYKLS